MESTTPYLGVIEGFFGRTWSFAERHDYADFLKNNGYQFYIYAPKADSYLRKSWQQDWSTETAEKLQRLVAYYQSRGVDFGLGLSPFEIYKNYNADAKQSLQDKIKRLN
ncbi:MAG: beta-N-acetylglucosaminidase domain-containing protein, partial [Cocleimonas sp.]|nr:beta-N-acetylglucosaminidase domain-containing protein [Cocleimonas sp.]